ncbi:energy transducer TonB [Emticicia sp. BO119]|uniref:energy transducer TonB n=1 Tax=Emticicia sp. BO119 TaxID=2757768 RepID=UPI0015F0C09A|nr:energy transducer TonB [Emticicia sp. BO119]MBA4851303.1 TonB family protein [Emticicia sp. BO119]
METPVPATTPVTLDEILFEHRNKDYGAYELRKSYTSTVNRAMWIGITAFSALFITSYIFAHQKEKVEKVTIVDLHPSLIKPDEIPPVVPLPEPEPPKEIVEVKKEKFMEPKVVETTEMEEVPPTQAELEVAVISNVDKEGKETTDIITETPPVIAPPAEVKIAEIEESNETFLHVEIQPTFVGGASEMYKFLGKALKYPSQAQRNNVEGRVYMSFIVEKDGSITDVQIAKGVGFGLDEEATRVVKLMPKWIPGKQNGRNVRVKFTIPVTFKLE